jgi:integrase
MRRLKKNQGLPDNCYVQNKGGKLYYRYKHPITKQFHGLGTQRAEALRAARLLNNRLLSTPTAEALVARVLMPQTTYAQFACTYRDTILPATVNRSGQSLAPKTLEEYRRYINASIDAFGAQDIPSITRREIAAHLEPMSPNTRNHARSVLYGLFARAIAEGYVETNPVEGTLKATVIVERKRLTWEQYQAIRAIAEPWLQRAMDLALLTLQRREDLVRMTVADIIDDGLHVRQQKTGMALRIRLWPELRALIPESGALISRNGAPVKKDYLSRAFADARDKVPELRAMPPKHRPSFHELRALGALRREQQGIDPQPLLGHTEAKTTRLYLDRHKERWIEI